MSRSIIARYGHALGRTAGLDQLGPVWHGNDDAFRELNVMKRLGAKASIRTRQKLSNSKSKRKISLAPVPWK